jgi:hypothetical protein
MRTPTRRPALNVRMRGSKSGNTVPGGGAPELPDPHADADLAIVFSAWVDLPPAIRVGIVAIVIGTRPTGASSAC